MMEIKLCNMNQSFPIDLYTATHDLYTAIHDLYTVIHDLVTSIVKYLLANLSPNYVIPIQMYFTSGVYYPPQTLKVDHLCSIQK